MKLLPISIVKLLLPLLLFLSIGGNFSFAYSIPVDEQAENRASETIRPVSTVLWAIREISSSEFSDPFEKQFFGSDSSQKSFPQAGIYYTSVAESTYYRRDIRKLLTCLTFPTHFFL